MTLWYSIGTIVEKALLSLLAMDGVDIGLSSREDGDIDDLNVRRSRGDVSDSISNISSDKRVISSKELLLDVLRVFREVGGDVVSVDHTGRNERHAKRSSDEFGTKRGVNSFQEVLGAGVDRVVGRNFLSDDGTDVNDVSSIALEHARNEQLHHLYNTLDVCVNDIRDIIEGDINEVAWKGPGGSVVDEDINVVSELSRQALEELVSGINITNVKLSNGDGNTVLGFELFLEISEQLGASGTQNLCRKKESRSGVSLS